MGGAQPPVENRNDPRFEKMFDVLGLVPSSTDADSSFDNHSVSPKTGPVPKSTSQTGRVVAFVVGINNYKKNKLKNAVPDAKAVATLLRKTGATVIYAENVTMSEFKKLQKEFLSKLQPGDVGMIYFAGHGCEYNNCPRLITIPQNDEDEPHLKHDAVNLLLLLARMEEKKNQDQRCNFGLLPQLRVRPGHYADPRSRAIGEIPERYADCICNQGQ